jgi:DNA-binding NarL/FixJ family response regulator
MKLIIVNNSLSLVEELVSEAVVKLGCSVINIYRSGKEFYEATDLDEADLVLVSCELPDAKGIIVAKKVMWKNPSLSILGIATKIHNITLSEMLEAGIKGCVFRKDFQTQLNQAITAVSKGKLYFPQEIRVDSF